MRSMLVDRLKIQLRRWRGQPVHPFTHFPPGMNFKTFLDIGANKGDYAWAYFASFPVGRAWLVEPIPRLHQTIHERLRKFKGRYELYDTCLGNSEEVVELHVTNQIGASSILPMHSKFMNANPSVKQVEVLHKRLVKLDELARANSIPDIDLMKVDVEGFESEVVAGGESFIKRSVSWILIEHSFVRSDNSQQRFIDVHSRLLSMGFDFYAICDQYHDAKTREIVQFDAIYHKR